MVNYNISSKYTNIECTLIVLLIFFLCPLLGLLLLCILNRNITNKAFIFCVIYAYIGYSIIFEDSNLDSYRYVEQFIAITQGYTVSIFDNLKRGIIDIYSIISMEFIALFSNNPHVLFALWAAIFGYFTGAVVNVIEKTIPRKSLFLIYVSIVVIILLNPPTNINGVRFWTAIWIAFAGILEYEICSRKRGMFFIGLTPLVHTSFLLFIVIYIIYRLVRHSKLTILLILFVISYILSYLISSTFIADIISNYLGPVSHFSAYIDESYVNEINEGKVSRSALNIFMTSLPKLFMILFSVFAIKYKKVMPNSFLDKALHFLFVYMTIVNILGVVPSVSRFDKLGYFIFLYIILLYHKNFSPANNLLLSGIIVIVFSGAIYITLEILPRVLDISILYPIFL